jgi:hypothetical protein
MTSGPPFRMKYAAFIVPPGHVFVARGWYHGVAMAEILTGQSRLHAPATIDPPASAPLPLDYGPSSRTTWEHEWTCS